MRRIAVVGSSGSGKTTMARAIAERLGHPHLELDSVFHQPDWTPLPDDEFQEVVGSFVAGEGWVVDGNYTSHGVNDIVLDRADTVVWLDPPRHTVMRRVVWRSLRRSVTGEELWNGNRERPGNLVRWAPEENIIRWTWTRFEHTRTKYESRLVDPRWQPLTVHRLRTEEDGRVFLADLG